MLDGKTDLPIGINGKNFDLYLIAFFEKIFDIPNVNVRDFRNVDQADFSAGEFNKCTEIGNPCYGPLNNDADFNRHTESRSPLSS